MISKIQSVTPSKEICTLTRHEALIKGMKLQWENFRIGRGAITGQGEPFGCLRSHATWAATATRS